MLTGKKVTLRPIQKEDLPALYKYRTDLEILILGDDDPPVPQSFEAWQEHMTQLTKKTEQGIGFAIEADEKVIGSIALFHFNETSRSCELGISIGDHDYLGKGYGSESVELILDYAFRYRNFHRVYLQVTQTNERAFKSYEKCGFVEEGRLRQHLWSDGAYRDVICMSMLRHEWLERA